MNSQINFSFDYNSDSFPDVRHLTYRKVVQPAYQQFIKFVNHWYYLPSLLLYITVSGINPVGFSYIELKTSDYYWFRNLKYF